MTPDGSSNREVRPRRGRGARVISRATAEASAVLLVAVLACRAGRWDAMAAVTVVPVWAWCALGLGLAGISRAAARSRLGTAAAGLWAVTLLVAPDEWRGVWRAAFAPTTAPSPHRATGASPALRVVSLNCRARNFESAREAAAWHPDILLLQEMRGGTGGPLASLARELWGDHGSVLVGYDTVILARGALAPAHRAASAAGLEFIQATLTLPDGRRLELASVHLHRHATDYRLWLPSAWKAHATNHLRHRASMSDTIVPSLEAAHGLPSLIGGDFNAPAGDAAFRALRARFRDAFAEAGTGWGNTYHNRWPIVRIDQIWATGELRPVAARAVSTRHSDHRMVVADYEWR